MECLSFTTKGKYKKGQKIPLRVIHEFHGIQPADWWELIEDDDGLVISKKALILKSVTIVTKIKYDDSKGT